PRRLQLHPVCSLFPYTTLFRSDTPALGDAAFEEFLGGQTHGEASVPDVQWVGEDGRARATGQLELCRLGRGLGEHLSFQDEFSGDRKSTRLNSSHVSTSYAVFC